MTDVLLGLWGLLWGLWGFSVPAALLAHWCLFTLCTLPFCRGGSFARSSNPSEVPIEIVVPAYHVLEPLLRPDGLPTVVQGEVVSSREET